MTILLYKDGHLVIDDGNPLEGVSLDGLVACVTDPQDGDTLTFDGTMWRNVAAREPAMILYVTEATSGSTTYLNKTWMDIETAVLVSHAVFIAKDADGVTTITPLASVGYTKEDGYFVTAGDATYSSETETGTLVKES